MPTLTIEYRDDHERLALEQAIAYISQLRQLALTAPDGTILAACEQRTFVDGRTSCARALDSRIDAAEQKEGQRDCARRRTPDAPRANTGVPS
jgi:hypothetical protein